METRNDKDSLKLRILKVKAKLPRQYSKAFFDMYPELNNYEGVTKLKNVITLNTADEEFTVKLESFVDNMKNA